MFERWTDRSRKALALANQEAQRFNHDYIGVEHLLLGIVKEGNGIAANILKNLEVDLRKVRLEVEKLVKSGPDMVTMGKLPHTPRLKQVLEFAVEEARNFNHSYIGTEHLLCAILRDVDGVAAQSLIGLGVDLEKTTKEIKRLSGVRVEKTAELSSVARPDWDVYFMSLCFVVAQRSIDPNTKHGCVVVSDDNTILSVGYNGPPRGCLDERVPLTRPEKYAYFSHSEVNAIANAARHGVALRGSTFYITGFPCEVCFRSMINVGAKTVVYGNIPSKCVGDDGKKIVLTMNNMLSPPIIMNEFTKHLDLQQAMTSALQYIKGN